MTHYLSILLFLPLVGAILLLFISKEKEDTFRWVANGVTLLEFVISIPLWFSFNPQNPDFQFVERAPWIPSVGAEYFLGIDGFSTLLILLTTMISFIAVLSSWNAISERVKEYYVCLLVLQTGMLGAFMARDFVIGPVENMKVGDCIDVPAEDAEFGTIQHHPCDQPHGGEIIEIFNVSGLPALLYPSSADPWSAISPVCASAFDAYTGTRFADRPEFDITYFTPTPKTWANGDRSVTCVVIRDDDAALTASLRRP